MILADYCCPCHGHFEQMVESPSPDEVPCPAVYECNPPATRRNVLCGLPSPWAPSPIRGRVNHAEVVRGTVDRPESPMMLDTRALGEGQPYSEWRESRDKMYRERRHKESKEL
jgi:hypothetical protein